MRRLLRPGLIAWIHLAVLWALGFAQPLFEVLADEPEFFVARGNSRADILILAFGLIVLPPTLLLLVELVLARVDVDRSLPHLLILAVLAAGLALQVLDDLVGGPSWLLIPLAVAAGAGVAAGYGSSRAVRALLSALAPAPVLFVGVFLISSPVSKLVFPQSEPGARNSTLRTPAPVVFVVFDELPVHMLMDSRQGIDGSRFPGFAALARATTWYRNATTVADNTTRAVPALLTGRIPEDDKLPIAADHPDNLFTLLGSAYDLHVVEQLTRLCPARLCQPPPRGPLDRRLSDLVSDLSIVLLHRLLPDDLDDRLPAVDRTFGDFAGGGRDAAPARDVLIDILADAETDRTRAFERFTGEIGASRSAGRPSLHFLHVALPHIPWQYLPSGQQYPVNGPDAPGLHEETWSDAPFPPLQGLQRHLLQLGHTDRLLSGLLDRLHEVGLYDRSLIVVVADHGASFRPGRNRRVMAAQTAADIAGVPLFIKQPGQREGRVEDGLVRTTDVLPTVARQLGADPAPPADGAPADDRRNAEGSVTVAAATGGSVRVSLSHFLAQRRRELARRIRLVGEGDGWSSVYGAGPRPDLIGRPLQDLPIAPPGGARIELSGPGGVASVDSRGGRVPAFVTGRLTGVRERRPLAVAVNGRLRASAVSFRNGSDIRLAAMIPPASLRSGANRIEVFAIRGATLVPLREESTMLRRRAADEVIARPGGELRVVPGAVAGFAQVQMKEGRLLLVGWAGDVRHSRVADQLLVFEGQRLLVTGAPRLERPDVGDRYGAAMRRSGFELGVDQGAVRDPSKVRVFAAVGGVASELPRPGAPPPGSR